MHLPRLVLSLILSAPYVNLAADRAPLGSAVAAIGPQVKRAPAVALIERGAQTEWRYLDDGTQPDATWTSADFDDTRWKQGRGPLGFGEPEVATKIGFGEDAQAKHLAAHFRRSFDFAGDPAHRQELWAGGKPTFVSRTSSLQLASHPLVTGSNRGRGEGVGVGFEALTFSTQGGVLHIRGKAVGEIPPYAAVAYVWPASETTDHGARTFIAPLDEGTFVLPLDGLRRANYRLTLASLHANGGTSTWDLPFGFNGKGEPDIATLTKTWSTALVERAERAVQERWRGARSYVADDVITHAPTAEARSKLRALRTALEP